MQFKSSSLEFFAMLEDELLDITGINKQFFITLTRRLMYQIYIKQCNSWTRYRLRSINGRS